MFSNIWQTNTTTNDEEDPPEKDEIVNIKENAETIFIRIDKKHLPNGNFSFSSNISITPFALYSTAFLFINATLFFVLGNIIMLLTIASRKLL